VARNHSPFRDILPIIDIMREISLPNGKIKSADTASSLNGSVVIVR